MLISFFWLNFAGFVVGAVCLALVLACVGVNLAVRAIGARLFAAKLRREIRFRHGRPPMAMAMDDPHPPGGYLRPQPISLVLTKASSEANARDPFAVWDGKGFRPKSGDARETVTPASWDATRKNLKTTFGAAMACVTALSLTSCGSTPTQQATLTVAGATLAAIAAQNNTTVASIVAKGALFCQLGGAAGIVAVVNAAGAPVSVTGQTSDAVAAPCAAFQAVPVPAPADPSSVPTKAAPTALPALTS